MKTMGNPRSAAVRAASPARMPRPPLYVGISGRIAISIERYAMLVYGRYRAMLWSAGPSLRPSPIAGGELDGNDLTAPRADQQLRPMVGDRRHEPGLVSDV